MVSARILERREKLIQWMIDNQELWKEIRRVRTPYVTHRKQWLAIANKLRRDGLFSERTSTIDIPVTKLVARTVARLKE